MRPCGDRYMMKNKQPTLMLSDEQSTKEAIP